MMWDVIVCTCQSTDSATTTKKGIVGTKRAVQMGVVTVDTGTCNSVGNYEYTYSMPWEMKIRQEKGLLSKNAILLAIDDPKPNIGSGSATLNALLCVAEYLAAREGRTAISEDAFFNARILILLLGTTFPFSPCGHGFMPHPSSSQPGEGLGFDQTEVHTIFDGMMDFIGSLCETTPPGVWVASTDMLLKVRSSAEPVDMKCFEEHCIVAMTVTSTPDYARMHGVCKLTDTGEFAKIIHQGGREQVQSCIRPDNLCDILAGIVYFSPCVLGHLLNLHTTPPLDACTYSGLDNGAEPLSLSLFFEMLVCLTTEISKESYVNGSFMSHKSAITADPIHQRARAVLWKVLKGLKMKAVCLPWVEHNYLRLVASDVLERYSKEGGSPCVINSIVPDGTHIENGSLLINCNLTSPISVGSMCFLSGLDEAFSHLKMPLAKIHIPKQLTVQEIHVSLGHGHMQTNHGIVVIYGIHDNLTRKFDSHGTFCNRPWEELFQRTGINESDLWLPHLPKTLLNARLFVASHVSMEVGVQQTFWLLSNKHDLKCLHFWRSAWRVSLSEILNQVDCRAEFAKLRNISFELQRSKMVDVLRKNRPECFLPFLLHATIEKKEQQILETLDQVAQEITNPLIVCRVYASIADLLGYMAGEGGIRAGPAGNVAWRSAFNLLEGGNLAVATRALAQERTHWVNSSSDRIIRAARHYERAGQILTRIAVATARMFVQGVPCPVPALNQPITVVAPARIDLAGSWTDTPPQSYELGGSVTTLALTINGEYPIKVISERISRLQLELVLMSGDGEVEEELELTELPHLANYSQPHAPGALIKAAFVCTGIIDFPSDTSLVDQLATKFGCGFKIRSIACLPQGSGLGTSSILGGAIMAALWRAAGQLHSHDSLIHAVLHLEQLLTTGGGWQDQCGGLYGGFKISKSGQGLPVHITTKVIEMKPGFVDMLNQHLLLFYTGKTRLARNLLQDVLRNWHAREPKMVKNMADIYHNSTHAAAAVEKGDLKELGACLTRCQEQKLIMAPGSLPKVASIFIEAIKEEIYGCVFAGAGGGGFISVLTKGPSCKSKIQKVITSNKVLSVFVLYEVAVDEKGLHYL